MEYKYLTKKWKRMNSFIKELKQYRHNLPKQTINTLRGQERSGNVEGAKKGLINVLNKR